MDTPTELQTAQYAGQQAGTIRVGVCGALGKMGREVVKTVIADPQLALAGVVDSHSRNETLNDIFGPTPIHGMHFDHRLKDFLEREKPEVCVDFTHPDVVFDNVMTMIQAGCRPVVGTTGLSQEQLAKIDGALKQAGLGGMVVPNFAIGAVLMMKFAQEASRYFDHAEIIEFHHNQKADAPSGTAIKTAELMQRAQAQFGPTNGPEKETIEGARGANGPADIHIHSVRLPGLVAHQEVILGGPGQILTIRHDSLDRTSFMPGVALAVKKVLELNGLVYGLENIL
jgi:4-hydroxy-tetrahydrodipicolinate reductase